jgi:hypothetical protein
MSHAQWIALVGVAAAMVAGVVLTVETLVWAALWILLGKRVQWFPQWKDRYR